MSSRPSKVELRPGRVNGTTDQLYLQFRCGIKLASSPILRALTVAGRGVRRVGLGDAFPISPLRGERVNSLAGALIVALLTLVSGLLGFMAQWLAPVQDAVDARAVVASIIGLVALLLALVLGLLVWMSYGLYTSQNSKSQSLGPLILKVDVALAQYGPEARRGRDLLRAAVIRARNRLWVARNRTEGVSPYEELRADLQGIMGFFAALEPATDRQKQLLTETMPTFVEVVETTLLMTRQLANSAPMLLTYVVMGWSALLFMSYGLLGVLDVLSVLAEIAGAIAIAIAIFVSLELNKPYSGLVRISPVGVDNLIATLGR